MPDPKVETNRGRAVHSSLARWDSHQQELTRNLYAVHRWTGIAKRRPAQGASCAGLLISRAKHQGARNCAKFTRPGNPIFTDLSLWVKPRYNP